MDTVSRLKASIAKLAPASPTRTGSATGRTRRPVRAHTEAGAGDADASCGELTASMLGPRSRTGPSVLDGRGLCRPGPSVDGHPIHPDGATTLEDLPDRSGLIRVLGVDLHKE